MHVQELTGLIPASFEAKGVDPKTGEETRHTIKIKLSRLAFQTVTKEGFADAMKKAETDPQVIGELLAGNAEKGTKGVLVYWELFEDEERTRMVEITVERVISLPYDFVLALAEAVMTKLFQVPATAPSSPAGSDQTEKSNSATAANSGATQTNSPDDTTSPEPAASGA